MLVAYYSKGCDSRSQFEGLKVCDDPSYEGHLNAHDVIKLDITLKQRGYPTVLNGIKEECVLVGVTYHEDSTEHLCRIERVPCWPTYE